MGLQKAKSPLSGGLGVIGAGAECSQCPQGRPSPSAGSLWTGAPQLPQRLTSAGAGCCWGLSMSGIYWRCFVVFLGFANHCVRPIFNFLNRIV